MMKSLKLPDWHELSEYKILLLPSIAIPIFFAYFFYRKLWVSVLLSPLGYFFYRQEKEKKQRKRKDEFSKEFKEMLLSISANLQAGFSIENAIVETRRDMLVMYGENSEIVSEVNQIIKGLRNRIPVEKLFEQFAKRTEIPEIEDFSHVFSVAKRTGGDLIGIIRSTSDIISKKIEVQNEITTQIAAKQMEQQIMNLVPFGITGYIALTSPHFFDSMYGNTAGVLMMTGCLFLYLISYYLSQKLIQIRV